MMGNWVEKHLKRSICGGGQAQGHHWKCQGKDLGQI